MKVLVRLSLLSALFFVFACGDEVENPGDDILKLDYMPIEVGNYWIYQNDSIVYDFGGSIVDTTSSYSKEEIIGVYTDNSGETIYNIGRYFKRNLSDPWEISDAWTCQKDSSIFIKTEENIKFLKLVFPPNNGTQWDGNVFINDDIYVQVAGESLQPYRYWDYHVAETDIEMTVEGQSYNNVMNVSQVNLVDDAYEWRLGNEYYARGVGLIYRRLEVLDAQCEPNCIGTFYDWAEKGYRLEQWLIEHN